MSDPRPTPLIYAGIDTVYDKIFNELVAYQAEPGSLITTVQKRYRTAIHQETNANLYPWSFLEYVGTSEAVFERSNRRWSYDLIIALVLMTYTKEGDQAEMVTRSNPAYSPGTVDLQVAVGDWFFKRNQVSRFGISQIKQWAFGESHTPTVRSIQRLFELNEFVDGVQLNFVIQMINKHEGE